MSWGGPRPPVPGAAAAPEASGEGLIRQRFATLRERRLRVRLRDGQGGRGPRHPRARSRPRPAGPRRQPRRAARGHGRERALREKAAEELGISPAALCRRLERLGLKGK